MSLTGWRWDDTCLLEGSQRATCSRERVLGAQSACCLKVHYHNCGVVIVAVAHRPKWEAPCCGGVLGERASELPLGHGACSGVPTSQLSQKDAAPLMAF